MVWIPINKFCKQRTSRSMAMREDLQARDGVTQRRGIFTWKTSPEAREKPRPEDHRRQEITNVKSENYNRFRVPFYRRDIPVFIIVKFSLNLASLPWLEITPAILFPAVSITIYIKQWIDFLYNSNYNSKVT